MAAIVEGWEVRVTHWQIARSNRMHRRRSVNDGSEEAKVVVDRHPSEIGQIRSRSQNGHTNDRVGHEGDSCPNHHDLDDQASQSAGLADEAIRDATHQCDHSIND